MPYMNSDASHPNEIERVKQQQRLWAQRRGFDLAPSGNHLANPPDALIAGALLPDTRAELGQGAGNELGRIHSLRSSSCLAVNVFEPWRRDPTPLASVFDVQPAPQKIGFEVKQPTGLKRIPPHLDVLLTGPGPTMGIECKFLELYDPAKNQFADAYFEKEDLWHRVPKCGALARRIARGEEQFKWLAAAQLLKHALGLSVNQPPGFRLLLVWYRVEGLIADTITSEIDRFAAGIDDIGFQAITYQELVVAFKALPEPMSGYHEYLADRYGL